MAEESVWNIFNDTAKINDIEVVWLSYRVDLPATVEDILRNSVEEYDRPSRLLDLVIERPFENVVAVEAKAEITGAKSDNNSVMVSGFSLMYGNDPRQCLALYFFDRERMLEKHHRSLSLPFSLVVMRPQENDA